MSILLFLLILIISIIVVRIGGVAFELTGLDGTLAKFQALSCFTGTGFTTKEAELITGNIERRKIASILMIVGYAGFVSLVATVVNSLSPGQVIPGFTLPFLHSAKGSGFLPWINSAIILIILFVIYKIWTNASFARGLTAFLKSRIIKKQIIKPVSFQELLVATGGYGISQIRVTEECPLINRTLLESGLRKDDITVLVVDRDGAVTPNPDPSTTFLLNDNIVCFGKLGNIRKRLL